MTIAFQGSAYPFLNRQDPPNSAAPLPTTPPATESPFQQPIERATRSAIGKNLEKLSLSFEINRGQIGAPVKFLSRGKGYNIFLTAAETVLALTKSGSDSEQFPTRKTAPKSGRNRGDAILRMALLKANPAAPLIGIDQLKHKSSYFVGKDSTKWLTDVPNYGKVKREGIYPGIDMVYYGNQRELEYDFIVAPGADPGVIQFAFEGAKELRVDTAGDLILKLGDGLVRQHAPFIYQQVNESKKQVAGRYVIRNGSEVAVQVDNYDRGKPLVIDPVLTYSTFIGGTSWDYAKGLAVDSFGRAYITGATASANFPTKNAYRSTLDSTYYMVMFVTKLNELGTDIEYSTFFGSTCEDSANAIAVDQFGNAYITGSTRSYDFPTVNAHQPQIAAGPPDPRGCGNGYGPFQDTFVTKFNATGNALLFSTYFGGGYHDRAYAIAVDRSGSAYITGEATKGGGTSGPLFPVTPGAFQMNSNNGNNGRAYWVRDGFVAKFTAAGALVYSTFVGSSGDDYDQDIGVDSQGNAWIAGANTLYYPEDQYPTTPGALQTTATITKHAVVAKLNATGTALLYGTYLSGSNFVDLSMLTVDASGNAYVCGTTSATGLPTTTGAYQMTSAGLNEAVLGKFKPTGALAYLTYLGTAGNETAVGVAADGSGNAILIGTTNSTSFPTPGGDPIPNTSGYTYVARFNPSGTALLYSTSLGLGAGKGIAASCAGNVYIAGDTSNAAYPTTIGAYQPVINPGGPDVFVTKMEIPTQPPAADANLTGPNPVNKTGFYKFPAVTDPDVLGDRMTELWAQIYRPSTLSAANYPVVILLHGNHSTCGRTDTRGFHVDDNSNYTNTGTCPAGYSVVNNHLGYDYLASQLASWGYIVASVNVNRGINSGASPLGHVDDQLILARGKMVLKHLQRLSEWNRPVGPLVISKTLGSSRNNLTSWVGMRMTVGAQPITVRSLGRIFVTGNNKTHTVKIVRVSDNVTVGSVSIAMTGGVNGQFKYVNLATAPTLAANTSYYVVTQETSGQDSWRDSNTVVATTAAATVNGRASSTNGTTWSTSGGVPNQMYGPVDFQYDIATPADVGVQLSGKLDLTNVGLMGHSRGGEGVLAAYNIYKAAGSLWQTRIPQPLTFKGIFEVAPTDNGYAESARADNVAWNVLASMCDRDVSDLAGLKVLDRMMYNTTEAKPKSSYVIWGGNHNFYNTEWQTDDDFIHSLIGGVRAPQPCLDHSPLFATFPGSTSQQQMGLSSFVAFFRANVGATVSPNFNQNFNPQYKLPAAVASITRVERAYTPSPNSTVTTVIDDFRKGTQVPGSGTGNDASNITMYYGLGVPEHDPTHLTGYIRWDTADPNNFFQTNWTTAGNGTNVSAYNFLDFRLSRQPDVSMNSADLTNFAIELVMADGTRSSAVSLCNYAELRGPVGGYSCTSWAQNNACLQWANEPHSTLQSVRIPFSDFTNADLTKIRGVRFTFNDTPTGAIYLANIRLTK